jgi:hypothetical protein
MAIKRNAPVQALDGAVEAAMGDDPVLGGLDRLRRAKRLTPSARRKAERDSKRTKVTYDWPADLQEQLSHIANQLGVPENQAAAVLMMHALRAYQAGEVDLAGRKIPSRSPRFEWFLRLDENEEE